MKFTALLGRASVPLHVDFGFGDAVTPKPETAESPTLLDFAAPYVRVYPKETVMADRVSYAGNGRIRVSHARVPRRPHQSQESSVERFPNLVCIGQRHHHVAANGEQPANFAISHLAKNLDGRYHRFPNTLLPLPVSYLFPSMQ